LIALIGVLRLSLHLFFLFFRCFTLRETNTETKKRCHETPIPSEKMNLDDGGASEGTHLPVEGFGEDGQVCLFFGVWVLGWGGRGGRSWWENGNIENK
jgi:hypothetical protein